MSPTLLIYCGGIKCIGFFLSLPVFSEYLYKIYDDWHPFAEKKLPAMAAERIRTKKLLAEVTKDLTPEQINGKSVSVF